MSGIEIFSLLMLGFSLGVISTTAWVVYLVRRKTATTESSKDLLDKRASLNSRMKRVKDITEAQLDLLSRTDGPQKNALDGKYKNAVNRTIKDLEQEKTDLLKSILGDGHDPEITTMDGTGETSKMKLSEFMAESGIVMPPSKEEQKQRSTNKFTLLKGGKHDSSSDDTTH